MPTEILGQPFALDMLKRALASGRFHHAWIFAGPRGVGKFTTAVELAKVLLDPSANPEKLGSGHSTGSADIEHKIDAGTHPDLHVIRKELAAYSEEASVRTRKLMNIPLAVLREHMVGGEVDGRPVDGPAYRTAALGHGKVFIIDEAELIDPFGQNTLLKTLEEPPAETYLILVTANPERLFPTILSRCQFVRFHRLDDDAMGSWAKSYLAELPGARRKWILEFAEGSPGVALRAIEYQFDQWQESLDPMLDAIADGEFPAPMGTALGEMVESFAEAWVKNNTNASKDAANKDGCSAVLSLLGRHARKQLENSASSESEAQPWIRCIELLREAESQLHSNVNHKLVLENLAAQWAMALRGTAVV